MGDLLTVEELAAILKVTEGWIYQPKDEIPHHKLGKYLRFNRARIEKWLEDQYE